MLRSACDSDKQQRRCSCMQLRFNVCMEDDCMYRDLEWIIEIYKDGSRIISAEYIYLLGNV